VLDSNRTSTQQMRIEEDARMPTLEATLPARHAYNFRLITRQSYPHAGRRSPLLACWTPEGFITRIPSQSEVPARWSDSRVGDLASILSIQLGDLLLDAVATKPASTPLWGYRWALGPLRPVNLASCTGITSRDVDRALSEVCISQKEPRKRLEM